MADTVHVLVTATLIEGAEVHPDDAHEDGSDGIAGHYGFVVPPELASSAIEAALDHFHEQIGIAELENYDIEAALIPSVDAAPDDTSWR